METISLETRRRADLVDITPDVRRAVERTGVRDGIVHVYCPHTTAGIAINENADPDVVRDFLVTIERAIPQEGDYRHGEGNADSHIKSVLVGAAQTIPLAGGALALGTWQGVFFCEFDGPRRRRVHVQILGA